MEKGGDTVHGILKRLRTERGETQLQLALAVGVTPSSISRYENGQDSPGGEILHRIAVHFGVSEAYILGKTVEPPRETGLPPDWDDAINRLRGDGFSAEDVEMAARFYRMAKEKRRG
jgi:transcriptional regulator with XRE-family HTH domain